MVDRSKAIENVQVPIEFNQLKVAKLMIIIRDKDPWEAKAINDRLLDEVLYSSFCYFGKGFSLYPFCEVIYGHKQELLLPRILGKGQSISIIHWVKGHGVLTRASDAVD